MQFTASCTCFLLSQWWVWPRNATKEEKRKDLCWKVTKKNPIKRRRKNALKLHHTSACVKQGTPHAQTRNAFQRETPKCSPLLSWQSDVERSAHCSWLGVSDRFQNSPYTCPGCCVWFLFGVLLWQHWALVLVVYMIYRRQRGQINQTKKKNQENSGNWKKSQQATGLKDTLLFFIILHYISIIPQCPASRPAWQWPAFWTLHLLSTTFPKPHFWTVLC